MDKKIKFKTPLLREIDDEELQEIAGESVDENDYAAYALDGGRY